MILLTDLYLKTFFFCCSSNIQSLANKVDQLQGKLSHFNVTALSETGLNPNISDDDIMFQNFQKLFWKDGVYHTFGSIISYFKENITCKRQHGLQNKQCEYMGGNNPRRKHNLTWSFYRPLNSHALTLDNIETSVDLVFDCYI